MCSQILRNFPLSVNFPVTKLKLERFLVLYLDQENILTDLELSSLKYKTTISSYLREGSFIPPFRFVLNLDLLHVQEISDDLLNLFVLEPSLGYELVKNVIFHAVQECAPVKNLKQSDIQVVINLTALPTIACFSDAMHLPTNELQLLSGILMAKTYPSKYVRSSVYFCNLDSCPVSDGQRFYSLPVDACPVCCGPVYEDVRSSDVGEEIFCHFISSKAFQETGRFQSLKVEIKDELCHSMELQLGQEYNFGGRLNRDCFETWTISQRLVNIEVLNKSQHSESIFLPDSVSLLYHRIREVCPYSPWAFVMAVSSRLACDIVPTSSHIHLKTGLLLSLATQKCSNPPVSIVAVGADTCIAQKLFNGIGRLAERYIPYLSTSCHLGGLIKQSSQPELIWQEAGPLILACNGVCNFGDWAKFKKQQADYICQTVESNRIVFHNETDLKAVMSSAPLKCAVWTYWNFISTRKSDQLQLKTLIDVFGMPFLTGEKCDLEIEKITRKILKTTNPESLSEKDPFEIPKEELKEYISSVNANELPMHENASELIRNYFVATRRVVPECLPIGAIKTITSLSQAHARLALRSEVIYEDVVAIIYLYQETMSALFGESGLDYHPKLIWNQQEPIYVFMDRQLQEFRIWLERYIESLLPGF